MPKGKKKFIDRKNAVTFHLVHRSQQDPLVADETAPQHVLVPAATDRKPKVDVKRKEEQKKYGIFFDDDYNYLQHLRDVNQTVDWEPVPRHPLRSEEVLPSNEKQAEESIKTTKIQLPSSVFASGVEEDVGLLNKAAPRSGLCLDLDPDVVAAMDEDFNFDDPDNILEDNFIELANAAKDSNSEDSDVSSNADPVEDSGDEGDDEVGSLNGSEFTFNEEETKSRFTNYSMSSSVMRRNEQLSLLDMRFEKLFAGYDDNEIGALDCEEIEGNVPPDSDLIMQCADQFEREKATQIQDTDKTLNLCENMYSDTDGSDMDVIEVQDKTADKWDCESILSTYSNLYNHPKLISEPQARGRIRVCGRTGIPLDVLDGSGNNKLTARALARLDPSNTGSTKHDRAESVISTLSVLSIRPKDESPEEKRDRKKAIKEYRKERRLERKANTLAFKEEKKRQEKILLNNKSNQQGIKIL